ncbi:MAG: c-type cytochrome, partial [Planctomycetota bacterium]
MFILSLFRPTRKFSALIEFLSTSTIASMLHFRKTSARARTLLLVLLVLPGTCARPFADDAKERDSNLEAVLELLESLDDDAFALDLLKGIHAGLRGRKNAKAPARWKPVHAKLSKSQNAELRSTADALALLFGDRQVRAALETKALDARQPPKNRQAALHSLLEARVPQLGKTLLKLLDDRELRVGAIRGLGSYAGFHQTLLSRYSSFSAAERREAILSLSTRPESTLALLTAVEKGKIPQSDIGASVARSISRSKDRRVKKRLRDVWGEVRRSPKEKRQEIQKYRADLTPKQLKTADARKGRTIFDKTCATCHVLYGRGTSIGPDLTGS